MESVAATAAAPVPTCAAAIVEPNGDRSALPNAGAHKGWATDDAALQSVAARARPQSLSRIASGDRSRS